MSPWQSTSVAQERGILPEGGGNAVVVVELQQPGEICGTPGHKKCSVLHNKPDPSKFEQEQVDARDRPQRHSWRQKRPLWVIGGTGSGWKRVRHGPAARSLAVTPRGCFEGSNWIADLEQGSKCH